MRSCLRFSATGLGAGATYHLQRVDTAYFRNFYFTVAESSGTYTVKCYRNRAEAEAGTSVLATGTHSAGDSTCTMTVDGGAPFDPTPMTLRLGVTAGTMTKLVLGWIDNPEAEIMARAAAILENYRAANEALEGIQIVKQGRIRPDKLPCIGVTVGESDISQGVGTELFNNLFSLNLFVIDYIADNPTVWEKVASYAGTLRSIALDEQRTWGGMAEDTKMRGTLTVAEEELDGGGFLLVGNLPLEVQIAHMNDSVDPADGLIGQGGKYDAGL